MHMIDKMADNNNSKTDTGTDREKQIYDCPGKVKSEVWRYFDLYKVEKELDTKKCVQALPKRVH